GLDHQHVGVAELIALIPELHLAHDRAEMKYRDDLLPGNCVRQHRMGMMMDHRMDVGPRLVDFAVNHFFAVQPEFGRAHRLGIERELDQVGDFGQLRRAMARDEIALRIVRMADADMAERVQHFFIAENAGCDDQFVQGVSKHVGHSVSPLLQGRRVYFRATKSISADMPACELPSPITLSCSRMSSAAMSAKPSCRMARVYMRSAFGGPPV